MVTIEAQQAAALRRPPTSPPLELPVPPRAPQSSPAAAGNDFKLVAALVGLSLFVQLWLVTRAALPALDAVGYVAVAQAIERDGLLATLRSEPEQPLFPLLVWCAHAIGTRCGAMDTSHWATSAQVAAAIPLLLAVVPVFYLLRRMVGRPAAVAGCIFFCTLYAVARLGADGISDSTHLLLLALGWCAAAAYLENVHDVARRRPLWLAASGVGFGLAMLARSEAILAPPALALTLVLLARRHGIAAWRGCAVGCGALALGLAVVLTPYLIVSDAQPPRTAVARLLGGRAVSERLPFNAPQGTPEIQEIAWQWRGGGSLAFGRKDSTLTTRFSGFWPAIGEFLQELFQTLQYVVALLAAIGLAFRSKRPLTALGRFCLVLAVTYAAGGLYVALTHGYLAGRHLMVLVVLALPWAGLGSVAVSRWLAKWLSRESLVRLGVVGGVGLACLSITITPLNASRAAHRTAADWVAAASESGAVLDTHGYSALYSGRKTYRYEAAPAAIEDRELRFVIVEELEFAAETARGETMRQVLGRWARPALVVPDPCGKPDRGVLVFRWQPQLFAQAQDVHHAR